MDDSQPMATYYPTCLLDSLGAQPTWCQYNDEIEAEYSRLCTAEQLLLNYVEVVEQTVKKLETYRLMAQELRLWMADWDLVPGFEPAYAVAHTLLRSHLEHLDFGQRLRFRTLMQGIGPTGEASTEMRQQALSLVLDLLEPKDFHTIAWAANS